MRILGKRFIYYVLLLAVVLIWGLDPIVFKYFYESYSAGVFSTLSTGIALIFFIIWAGKRLRTVNLSVLKIAIPISLLKALGNILQRIGLQYTSPAAYSFLENLSCVIVPIAMVILTRKFGSTLVWLSAVMSLAGCIVLVGFDGLSGFGVGELLCSVAGIFLGFGEATTGLFTKKIDIVVFMTIFMATYFLSSLCTTFVLGFIPIGGRILEPIVFSESVWTLIAALGSGLLSVGVCWFIEILAVRNINPASTTVIVRLCVVVTGVFSVIAGYDKFSVTLAVSAVILVLASVVAAIASEREVKNEMMHSDAADESIAPKTNES